MLVARHERLALGSRNLHRYQLRVIEASGIGVRGALLAAQRKAVLVGARDVELRGDVFAGLGHRVDAVALAHARVDEAPAEGRVMDLRAAAEGGVGLRQDEWRA